MKKLNKEIELSRKLHNIVPNAPGFIDRVPIQMKLDMQWPLRGGGHAYMSPSGTIHGIGGITNGIVSTALMCNKCVVCDRVVATKSKLNGIKRNAKPKMHRVIHVKGQWMYVPRFQM